VSNTPVLLFAAMPRELRRLARVLRLMPGSVAGLPAWSSADVVAVVLGVGPTRARTGSRRVLDVLTPRRVLITGVAGGVDPSLRVGDLVRPASVVDVRSGAVFTPGGSVPRAGLLATVEEIFLAPGGEGPTPAPSPGLPAGTTAVDMETAAIAAVCEARNVAWDVARAVSDVAGTLTPEIAALLRPDGRVDGREAARLLVRDPGSMARLARLGRDTSLAVRIATSAAVAELASEAARARGDG
jgi:adenosylhomocysteine nucleosidase